MFVEIFGVLSSAMVVYALLKDGELRMRKYNIIGSSFLVVYGFMISSLSVILLNVGALVINIYKTRKLKQNNRKEDQ